MSVEKPSIKILDPLHLNKRSDQGYSFKNWKNETVVWPKTRGANLGSAGAFNFFLRVGFKPEIISGEGVSRLTSGDLLVVDVPEGLECNSRKLDFISNLDCAVLFTGCLSGLKSFFPDISIKEIPLGNSYDCLDLEYNGRETPLNPPNWGGYQIECSPQGDTVTAISLSEITGDRFSPSHATRRKIPNAFLLLKGGRENRSRVFLNGFVFAALQAWLQGQEDLLPWSSWNSRQHWLDDYVDLLFEALKNESQLDFENYKRLESLPPLSVNFRHDSDSSKDISFCGIEEEMGVQATYSILDDSRVNAWKQAMKKYPSHEFGFHFPTLEPKWKIGRYGIGMLLNQYHRGKKVLSRGNLIQLVKKAKSQGIGIRTIHRHFAYLPYPEIIDELEGVYQVFPEVLASSTFFRCHKSIWGGSNFGVIGHFPDVQFPYWMPFKVAHAADGGRILRGWESTAVMEVEPEFFENLSRYRNKNLPSKFMTFILHPCHGSNDLFCKGGTEKWLKQYIEIGKTIGCHFTRHDHYIEKFNSLLEV